MAMSPRVEFPQIDDDMGDVLAVVIDYEAAAHTWMPEAHLLLPRPHEDTEGLRRTLTLLVDRGLVVRSEGGRYRASAAGFLVSTRHMDYSTGALEAILAFLKTQMQLRHERFQQFSSEELALHLGEVPVQFAAEIIRTFRLGTVSGGTAAPGRWSWVWSVPDDLIDLRGIGGWEGLYDRVRRQDDDLERLRAIDRRALGPDMETRPSHSAAGAEQPGAASDADRPQATVRVSAAPCDVDVLIVTAIKDEYDEALKVDDGAVDDWSHESGPTGLGVALRSYRTASGGTMRIALTRALEMRGVAAANAAWPLIAKYSPRCLAMCGVCAGRRGDTNLGDVLVADTLFTYDTGSVAVEYGSDGKRHSRYKSEPSAYRISASWKHRAESFAPPGDAGWLVGRPVPLEDQGLWLLQQLESGGQDPANHPDRAQRCPTWSEALTRLRRLKLLTPTGLRLTGAGRARIREALLLHPDGLPGQPPFKVRVGPIATGSSVTRDPRIFDRLSKTMRKILGVEMEAAAIAAVAHVQNIPHVIVMKGVMDHADEDKDDGFKKFAARASAECLIAFLRENLPSHAPNGLRTESRRARTDRAAGLSIGAGAVPSWLVGLWQGQWAWRDKARVADLAVDASGHANMVVRYATRGSDTTVEQQLTVVASGGSVELVAVGFRFLERGRATGWHLDSFDLEVDAGRRRLTGSKRDKRGIDVPVVFRKA